MRLILLCFVALFSLSTGAEEKPRLLTAKDLASFPAATPDKVIAYGKGAEQFGELYLPKAAKNHPVPVIFFIHGGCWYKDYDIAHTRFLTRALSEQGFAVWSAEFRRIGNEGGGYPGTFMDVLTAGQHISAIAKDYNLDMRRVVVAGHSAGGQLALWYTRQVRVKPRAVVAMAPAADLTFMSEQKTCGDAATKLMGGTPREKAAVYQQADTTLAPVRGVPQTIFVGKLDKVWTPIAMRYVDVLKKQKIDHHLVVAPLSGHFEMIDPRSSTFPLLVRELTRAVGLRGPLK